MENVFKFDIRPFQTLATSNQLQPIVDKAAQEIKMTLSAQAYNRNMRLKKQLAKLSNRPSQKTPPSPPAQQSRNQSLTSPVSSSSSQSSASYKPPKIIGVLTQINPEPINDTDENEDDANDANTNFYEQQWNESDDDFFME